MGQMPPAEFDAVTRLDFHTFIDRVFNELNPTTLYQDNFHIGLVAAEFEAMRRGEVRRLAITLPPRNLKSIISSIAFVAWLLGQDPAAKIICVSYGQELADSLARQCRQVMQSEWYQRLFPKTRLAPSRLAVSAFETTAGGFRIATSIGGVLTGLGADYILIDDPVKPEEALSEADRGRANHWFRHTLLTRLNDKRTGRIAIIMQRLHEDDMIGHVLQLEPWKLIRLPAIAVEDEVHVIQTAFGSYVHRRREGEALHHEREPLSILEHYQTSLGPYHFAAQFQQEPVSLDGGMIKLAWFGRYDHASPPAFSEIIHSWDTASKATQLSGWSVCTIWGIAADKMYLLDVIRARFEYPDLRATALALARGQYRGHRRPEVILIEDKASGQSLIQDMRREGVRNITEVKPEGDKITRMHSQTAVIANGHVLIPEQVPWLPDYLGEIVAFPGGRYADQVDSTSQALKWFNYKPEEPGIITYYRQLAEEHRLGPRDDRRMVALRSSTGCSLFLTRSGEEIRPDPEGRFHMPWGDAKFLLYTFGWSLVEE